MMILFNFALLRFMDNKKPPHILTNFLNRDTFYGKLYLSVYPRMDLDEIPTLAVVTLFLSIVKL